ncbi:MAG: hypothetical protein VR72_17505 [Clostridiaceae bacterium BRH_c20a]|nr:MAG: hypothetical protein VR72_17505 [Clostridiaceae bacterium BRH_c20a]
MEHLTRKGIEFWPSKYGGQIKNYSLKLDKPDLLKIKKEAFIEMKLFPQTIVEGILRKTLASGVCSGISAYTLCEFYGYNNSNFERDFLIAVLQARTWGADFLHQALQTYFLTFEHLLSSLKKGIKSDYMDELPLLVLLPRVIYLKEISYSHTVVPFCLIEGLQNTYIKIADSNFPGDDNRVLRVNRVTGFWEYNDKDSREWVLTLNYLGKLTRKVSFLL